MLSLHGQRSISQIRLTRVDRKAKFTARFNGQVYDVLVGTKKCRLFLITASASLKWEIGALVQITWKRVNCDVAIQLMMANLNTWNSISISKGLKGVWFNNRSNQLSRTTKCWTLRHFNGAVSTPVCQVAWLHKNKDYFVTMDTQLWSELERVSALVTSET